MSISPLPTIWCTRGAHHDYLMKLNRRILRWLLQLPIVRGVATQTIRCFSEMYFIVMNWHSWTFLSYSCQSLVREDIGISKGLTVLENRKSSLRTPSLVQLKSSLWWCNNVYLWRNNRACRNITNSSSFKSVSQLHVYIVPRFIFVPCTFQSG